MRKLIISGVSPLDASRKALEHKGRAFLNETELQVVRDDKLVEQLYRAARGLDCELLESRIRTHLEKNSIESTWHGLLVPLLILVGDEWKESGTGIEVERLLSEVILRIFNSKITVVDSKSSTRPVLIASIGEETHSLAITALAAALSERGIAVQFLGARTPKSAINEVVRRSAPAAIFLWAQLRKHADASFITDLPSIRPKPKVIIGGPGWGVKHYAEFHRAADLSAACSQIERAVGL
jgi:methanogenic corrinoid protein MtbC1